MKKLTTQALREWQAEDEDFVLVDVLPPASYADKHIPGAENVPAAEQDFVQRVEQIVDGDRTRPVVVYCASATCELSPTAARRLEQAGFKNVYDYEDGIQAWETAGHETEAGHSA